MSGSDQVKQAHKTEIEEVQMSRERDSRLFTSPTDPESDKDILAKKLLIIESTMSSELCSERERIVWHEPE